MGKVALFFCLRSRRTAPVRARPSASWPLMTRARRSTNGEVKMAVWLGMMPPSGLTILTVRFRLQTRLLAPSRTSAGPRDHLDHSVYGLVVVLTRQFVE